MWVKQFVCVQIICLTTDSESKAKGRLPANLREMVKVAQKMSSAVKNSFKYGVAYKLSDYPADGALFDYMAGVYNVSYCWTWSSCCLSPCTCYSHS